MKIGIDLGGTNIRVGLVENGSLVRKEVVTCPSKATYEEVLGRLEGLIDRVMCPGHRRGCSFGGRFGRRYRI